MFRVVRPAIFAHSSVAELWFTKALRFHHNHVYWSCVEPAIFLLPNALLWKLWVELTVSKECSRPTAGTGRDDAGQAGQERSALNGDPASTSKICPACGEPVRIIACTGNPVVIQTILGHLKNRAEATAHNPLPGSRPPICSADIQNRIPNRQFSSPSSPFGQYG